ncbi:MAG TPA: response regulator transcription factor [Nitrospirae bacterium]|nr:response regulator transcription factor [Nitrospirota bacterium]
MTRILLCSCDQMLTKGLYPVLRDSGYDVDTIEHPAEAIKMILQRHYAVAVLDSKDVGLSAKDASAIIRKIDPTVCILVISNDPSCHDNAEHLNRPVSLSEVKSTLDMIIGNYKKQYKEGGLYDTKRDGIKSL